MTQSTYALGVDPAKHKATFCLLDEHGSVSLSPFDAPASQEGFDLVRSRLDAALAPGDLLLVGVEASCALDDNWLAFFSTMEAPFSISVLRLDAAQVKHFSGPKPLRSKTDHADARRIAQFLRTYAGELARFRHDPQAQAMLVAVNERATLIEDLTRLKNRLRDRLILAFPELERHFPDPSSPQALALLQKAPTASAVARLPIKTLATLRAPEKGSHCLGEQKAGALREAARNSIGCRQDDLMASVIRHLAAQIHLLRSHVAELEATIEAYVASATEPPTETIPDPPTAEEPPPSIPRQIALLDTIPGMGLVTASTLVLRSQGLTRFHNAKAFAAQLAACPDRMQTGTSKDYGRLARRGDRRARPLLFLAARTATTHDICFAFHKWRHMQAGQTAKQAICTCMNRLARIAWTLVRSATSYDPAKALANLHAHHDQTFRQFIAEHPKWQKKLHSINNRPLT